MKKYLLKILHLTFKRVFQNIRLKSLSAKLIFTTSALVIFALFLSFINFGKVIKEILQTEGTKKALSVSITLSNTPDIIAIFQTKQIDGEIEKMLGSIKLKTGIKFIQLKTPKKTIYFDNDDIILTTQDEDFLTYKYGKYFTKSIFINNKRYTIAQTPVYFENTILGLVSVAFEEQSFKTVLSNYSKKLFSFIYLIIMITIIVAIIVSFKIKHSLLGFEPKELSFLFLEKDAIINSAREAILAIDTNKNLRLFNAVAQSYFNINNLKKALPIELKNIMETSISQNTNIYDKEIIINKEAYICNISPIIKNNLTLGAVATCRKKDEIDKLVIELTKVKKYSETLRQKKHEFSNLLHLIYGYVQTKNYESIKNILFETGEYDNNIIQNLRNKINDPTLLAVFIGKYYYALENGVRIIFDEDCYISSTLNENMSQKLSTILGNIINNAIDEAKHSTEKKIWISGTDVGNELIIEVEDSGRGINESDIEKLFQKGYTTKKQYGNIGYGLYLVKTELEEIGGSISVSNTKNGALFTVYLPLK